MFYLYLCEPGSDNQYLLTNNRYSAYSPTYYKILCENPSSTWGVVYENPGDRYQLLATINSYQELVDQFPGLFI